MPEFDLSKEEVGSRFQFDGNRLIIEKVQE
jgi:hypothetical protein